MRLSSAALSAVLSVVGLHPAAARAATWVGGSGSWGTPTNWNPANVPNTTSEAAVINAGTATLNAGFAIGSLELNGGALDGASSLTTNVFTWTVGALNGTGILTATLSTLESPANGFLRITGRTLNLLGSTGLTTTTNDLTGLSLGANAVVNNSGTFTMPVYGQISRLDESSVFNNSGTLRTLSGRAGDADVSTNTGKVTSAGNATVFCRVPNRVLVRSAQQAGARSWS